MVKKSKTGGSAKRKSAQPPKAGVRIRIKENPKFSRRLEQLGADPNAVNEPALAMFFELQQKHKKPAEVALLYDAAIRAMQAAAFESDDLKNWIKAARKAAQLE